jgi:hypothetical protein
LLLLDHLSQLRLLDNFDAGNQELKFPIVAQEGESTKFTGGIQNGSKVDEADASKCILSHVEGVVDAADVMVVIQLRLDILFEVLDISIDVLIEAALHLDDVLVNHHSLFENWLCKEL